MTARTIGLLFGVLALAIGIFVPPPAEMSREAFIVAGLVVLMASWWMTEAIPLTATALMPFLVLPFAGVSDARETASTYYSPILFLLLGGAFLALAIERTGLHKRLAVAILNALGGRGGQTGLLYCFHGECSDPFDAHFQYVDLADHDADGAGRSGGRRHR